MQVGVGSLWGLIDYQFGDIGKYVIESKVNGAAAGCCRSTAVRNVDTRARQADKNHV